MDHKAYIPSITLAGAAEEILGQSNGEDSAFVILKRSLSSKFSLNEKVVSQSYLNHVRNWLKHWDKKNDLETIEIEPEAEAIQYIIRALVNIYRYDNSLPSQGPRFIKWLVDNKSDLIDPSSEKLAGFLSEVASLA